MGVVTLYWPWACSASAVVIIIASPFMTGNGMNLVFVSLVDYQCVSES